MSLSKPLRRSPKLQSARERNAVLRGQEAMWGDIREAKGAPEPVYEKERTWTRRTDIVTESQHQITAIAWWDKVGSRQYKLPTYALAAIPNGGMRDIITAAKLRREGVRAGIPDLMLMVPRHGWSGLFIEQKRQDGRLSAAQIEIMAWLTLQGYMAATCYSADETIAAVQGYLG